MSAAQTAPAAADSWLIFGERNAAQDLLLKAEIEALQRRGHLQQLDIVFLRDQSVRLDVQHRLRYHADELTKWVRNDAAIYA